MKSILLQTAFLAIIAISLSFSVPNNDTISAGEQPQLSMDTKGIVRVVFGRNDSIFCSTSIDEGAIFSKPVLVGHVPQMNLGMAMGPQIASSANYSIVTAMDEPGDIHFFQLHHSTGRWTDKGVINDIRSSAPEGLMGIAADRQDNFYAVWLDIRQGKKNNICFSSLSAKEDKWAENKIIYTSPDEHVCECCKPSIAVKGSRVNIMFRNWLSGSRDLYFIQSANRGEIFGEAQKLGNGTWKLKGCPMDGGGIAVDKQLNVHTTWQRKGKIFYAQPQKDEIEIGTGRACSIAAGSDPVITWQDGSQLKVQELNSGKTTTIGDGSFLKAIRTKDNKILCVWENENKIVFKKL